MACVSSSVPSATFLSSSLSLIFLAILPCSSNSSLPLAMSLPVEEVVVEEEFAAEVEAMWDEEEVVHELPHIPVRVLPTVEGCPALQECTDMQAAVQGLPDHVLEGWSGAIGLHALFDDRLAHEGFLLGREIARRRLELEEQERMAKRAKDKQRRKERKEEKARLALEEAARLKKEEERRKVQERVKKCRAKQRSLDPVAYKAKVALQRKELRRRRKEENAQ